jgi:hypothetical protein
MLLVISKNIVLLVVLLFLGRLSLEKNMLKYFFLATCSSKKKITLFHSQIMQVKYWN